MEFGTAPRVSPVGGINLPPRSDIVATQGSVAVELPPEKTVQSVQIGDAVQLDIKGKAQEPPTSSDARSAVPGSDQAAAAARAAERLRAQNLTQDQDRSQARAQAQSQDQAKSQDQAQIQTDARDAVERRLVIEPRTNTIVLEKTDRDTGETVSLLPDEATLKLRIYTRQLAERARAEQAANSFERTA